jgi:hypothetical protein
MKLNMAAFSSLLNKACLPQAGNKVGFFLLPFLLRFDEKNKVN